jgi:hypothetical protein
VTKYSLTAIAIVLAIPPSHVTAAVLVPGLVRTHSHAIPCAGNLTTWRIPYGRASATTILPPGARTLRLCRYLSERSSAPGRLLADVLVERPSIIEALTNALDVGPFLTATGCPVRGSPAAVVVVRAAYPTRAARAVLVQLTDCQDITNGRRTVFSDSTLPYGLLSTYTHLGPWPLLGAIPAHSQTPSRTKE